MNHSPLAQWIAFSGNDCIASGVPENVATDVKRFVDSHPVEPVLVFDAKTSAIIEVDFRGPLADVLVRLPVGKEPPTETGSIMKAPARQGAGRPKLGVVPREVTLLPRHWEWLATQAGGASVTLRKLVEHAMRAARESDRMRQAQEAAYNFMVAMAGNNQGFEEASRALFAGNIDHFRQCIGNWPADIRDHLFSLASAIDTMSGGAS